MFSYEVMGLVGREGAGAHDLLRLARQGRILDWAGESQYYVEPKRLAKLGYLDARSEPGRTRPRTVYRLSEQGLEALREYAATPVTLTPLKSEPLLRLLIADLAGERVTRSSLATLRADLADLEQRLDEAAESAAALPHPKRLPADREPLPAPLRRPARRAGRRGRARAARLTAMAKGLVSASAPPTARRVAARLIRPADTRHVLTGAVALSPDDSPVIDRIQQAGRYHPRGLLIHADADEIRSGRRFTRGATASRARNAGHGSPSSRSRTTAAACSSGSPRGPSAPAR